MSTPRNPVQFCGPGPQMNGELRPGLGRSTAQRVQQRAVVVGGPAELAAGMLGQGQGQPLFILLNNPARSQVFTGRA